MYGGATNLQSTSAGTLPLSWNAQKDTMKLDSEELDLNGMANEDDKSNVSIFPWMTRVHSNNSEWFKHFHKLRLFEERALIALAISLFVLQVQACLSVFMVGVKKGGRALEAIPYSNFKMPFNHHSVNFSNY